MTGIVYDNDFTGHRCLWDEDYSENPQRYTAILERCEALGLIDRCVKIDTRLATKEELLSKHTAEHVDLLESTENYTDEELERVSSKYDSIYLHPFTNKQSLLAAGSSIELAKAVVNGRVQNGMALVRPPGHHAMKSEYCGYCFLNNVAITSQHLLDTTATQRILIVDWDVHHGQATQQMFYDDPRVLYFSIHRYEHGRFWPNLRESDFDRVGDGRGVGFNVNVPLNNIAMENKDYMAIIHYLLTPLAIEFAPDLIIVSCGYDSAIGDPKGEMLVTPACYAHITRKLMSLVNGKVIAILEGGYYLTSLAESAALTLRALLGDPCPVIKPLLQPCQSVMDTIHNVIHTHSDHWECFKYSVLNSENSTEIRYDFTDEKPKVYQTRNMYPKVDTTHFDKLLNDIIAETKLFVPRHRMGIVLKQMDHASNNNIYRYLKLQMNHLRILQERCSTVEELNLTYATRHVVETLNLRTDGGTGSSNEIHSGIIENDLKSFCFAVGSLLQVIDSMSENEIQSGMSVLSTPTDANDRTDASVLSAPVIGANYAVEKKSFKRILIVEFINDSVEETHRNNDRIMVVSVQKSLSPAGLKSVDRNDTGNRVNILWPKDELNDAEFTAMMQHVILPIGYEYNPELIIVSAKFCSNNNRLNGIRMAPVIYGHLVQWLSTLANGKIIVHERPSAHDNSIYRQECLLQCSKALLDNPIPKLCVEKRFSIKAKNILHSNIKNYTNRCKSLQLKKS